LERKQRYDIRVDAVQLNGKIQGNVSVCHGRKIVGGMDSEDLRDPEEFDLIVEAISEWFTKPEDTLREAIDAEVQTIEAGAGRDDPRPAPLSAHHRHARYYISRLQLQGRFVRASDATFYLDNESRMPVNVKSDKMLGVLAEKFEGLNETRPVTKYLMSELKRLSKDESDEVEVQRHSHFDRNENTLLIDMGVGRVLRLDGKTPPTGDRQRQGRRHVSGAGAP